MCVYGCVYGCGCGCGCLYNSSFPFRVTLQEWNELDDVVAKWVEQGESSDLIDMVKEVHHYIDLQKEIGASVRELKVCTVCVCVCTLCVSVGVYCACLCVCVYCVCLCVCVYCACLCVCVLFCFCGCVLCVCVCVCVCVFF